MKYVYGKQSLHICLRSSVILNICQRSLWHCCLRQYWLMHRWILSGHYGRYAPSHTIKVIIIPCRSYKTRSYQHHILWTTSCQTVIYWPPTCVKWNKLTVMMDDADFQLHDDDYYLFWLDFGIPTSLVSLISAAGKVLSSWVFIISA